MKKVLFTLLLASCSLVSMAKIEPTEIKLGSENPEGTVIYVGELKNKPALAFTFAKQWISKTFNDYKAVVQLEDNESRKVVLKGRSQVYDVTESTNFGGVRTSSDLCYTITIDVHEGKFRVKVEDMSIDRLIQTGRFKPSQQVFTFEQISNKLADETTNAEFVKQLTAYMQNSKETIASIINGIEDALNQNDDF